MSTTLFVAVHIDFENTYVQVCDSVDAAIDWLAFESITAEAWTDFVQALSPDQISAASITPTREGMTARQVLEVWAPISDSENLEWGEGDYLMSVQPQQVYSGRTRGA